MMTSKLVCECGVVNDNDARYCKMCGLGKDDKQLVSVLEDFRRGVSTAKVGYSGPYSWGDHGICTNG